MNNEVVTPEVVEENTEVAAVKVPEQIPVVYRKGHVVNMTAAEALKFQYDKCQKATGAATREMVIFGAMLQQIDDGLTKKRFASDGNATSLRSWLEENCPDVNYNTAKAYQRAAEGVRKLCQIANDRALLPLMTGVAADTGADTDELRAKIVETISNSSLNILRKAALPNQPGNLNKGTIGIAPGRRALTAEENAAEAEKMMREMVDSIGAYLRGPWFDLLTAQSQDDLLTGLNHYVEVIRGKVAENL